MKKALVVLSGGQDSVTCLAWALKEFDSVEAITFDYGQRHAVELVAAKKVCEYHNIPQKVVDVSFFGELSTSALIGDRGDVKEAHPLNKNLPASYVPNRNALFLTTAHAWAQTIGATEVVTGVCQTDYSGYPDCRLDFITALNMALNLGSAAKVEFHTPLMFMTKAETFAMAEELGCMFEVLELSHTCYEGNHTTRNDWGYGCGNCPSCDLRRQGWEVFEQGKT